MTFKRGDLAVIRRHGQADGYTCWEPMFVHNNQHDCAIIDDNDVMLVISDQWHEKATTVDVVSIKTHKCGFMYINKLRVLVSCHDDELR